MFLKKYYPESYKIQQQQRDEQSARLLKVSPLQTANLDEDVKPKFKKTISILPVLSRAKTASAVLKVVTE